MRLSIGKHTPVLLDKNSNCGSSLEAISAGEPPGSPVDGVNGEVTNVLYKLETLMLLLTLGQRHLVVLNQNH